jgi:hypothetical protein
VASIPTLERDDRRLRRPIEGGRQVDLRLALLDEQPLERRHHLAAVTRTSGLDRLGPGLRVDPAGDGQPPTTLELADGRVRRGPEHPIDDDRSTLVHRAIRLVREPHGDRDPLGPEQVLEGFHVDPAVAATERRVVRGQGSSGSGHRGDRQPHEEQRDGKNAGGGMAGRHHRSLPDRPVGATMARSS